MNDKDNELIQVNIVKLRFKESDILALIEAGMLEVIEYDENGKPKRIRVTKRGMDLDLST